MLREVLKEKWVRWAAVIAIVIVCGLFLYGKGYNDKRDEIVKAFSKIGNSTKDIKNTSDDVEEKFEDLGTVNVGDIASYGNINFKITGSKVCKELSGPFGRSNKPELGQYVVVDMEGENVGSSPEKFYSSNFRLADSDGHDYDYDISSSITAQKKYHSHWGEEFKPGGKKKFRLSFDVPEGDIANYKIQIKYNNGIQYMALA
jgi:hypothetical protein